MPTKDQLRSIEWAGEWRYDYDWTYPMCPACEGLRPESAPERGDSAYTGMPAGIGHAPDCWLSAALATPDTLPPVEVGDEVLWRFAASDKAEWMTVYDERHLAWVQERAPQAAHGLKRILWLRGKE